jgi:hypothetical protein
MRVDTAGQRGSRHSWSTQLVNAWVNAVNMAGQWGVNVADRVCMSQHNTYFVGLPLLGSPLVISDPSVATYDLLMLAHIIGRWV